LPAHAFERHGTDWFVIPYLLGTKLDPQWAPFCVGDVQTLACSHVCGFYRDKGSCTSVAYRARLRRRLMWRFGDVRPILVLPVPGRIEVVRLRCAVRGAGAGATG
jgi:hypothetical protein